VAEHRLIESPLEAFLQALLAGTAADELFRRVLDLAERHFELEENVLFAAVRGEFPGLVSKMEAEHLAVREIGEAFETSRVEAPDRIRLGRQFHAMLQHHLIEEERDFFPLLARHLDEERQAALAAKLSAG
jgi:hemerythrin-like domain-containing protein